jgi:hypothetical protein
MFNVPTTLSAFFACAWTLAGCGGSVEVVPQSGPADSGASDAPPAFDSASSDVATAAKVGNNGDGGVDGVAFTVDGNPPDSPDEMDSGACYEGTPFSPPVWKTPSPMHQGVCTPGDLGGFLDCVGTPGCTSGNAQCDGCLMTSYSSTAFGPLVTGSSYSDVASGLFINWGGCQANVDGHTESGSCGNETNNWQTCAHAECSSTCTDANECDDYAYFHACLGNTESASCAEEWGDADSGVPPCADLSTLVTIWCGS